MTGKQVYIDEKHHKKLKLIASAEDTDMKSLLENQIDQMETDSIDDIDTIIN